MSLEGIRVLDLGWIWAGALPGQMLAFQGAEVIKVESRKRLDSMRMGLPVVGDELDPEQQPMFHNVNRGKLSLTVDLQHPEGRDLILDLVEHCDVAIENFSPGTVGRLGLGYDALRQRRPDLVMLSLSGGGQHGHLRDFRSYAATIAAYCGLDALSGYEGEEPLGIQQPYGDPNASVFAAVALMAALARRQRTGEGDHIDLAQLDAGLAVVGEAMAATDLLGGLDAPLGNAAPGAELIHGTFRCGGEDDWVSVVVEDRDDMDSLAELLGGDGLDVSETEQLLERWCLERSHVEAMEGLQAAGVAAGSVMTAHDRFVNTHYQERGIYRETEHPVIGWEVVYEVPWKVKHGPPNPELRRAPLMGEHNEYVICDLLGRPADELERLTSEGVLQ